MKKEFETYNGGTRSSKSDCSFFGYPGGGTVMSTLGNVEFACALY